MFGIDWGWSTIFFKMHRVNQCPWNLTFKPLRPSDAYTSVSNLTIIGSDNGLSPGRRQAIIWINAGILLIGPLGTNFNEILIEIQTFSFRKIHLKMSSGKWRPFCLGLNVLKWYYANVGSQSGLIIFWSRVFDFISFNVVFFLYVRFSFMLLLFSFYVCLPKYGFVFVLFFCCCFFFFFVSSWLNQTNLGVRRGKSGGCPSRTRTFNSFIINT